VAGCVCVEEDTCEGLVVLTAIEVKVVLGGGNELWGNMAKRQGILLNSFLS
jgi:hypothetical protein